MSPDESWAIRQDQADPLASVRDEFEHPQADDGAPLAYFCGNSLGLMPRAVRGQLNQELDDWGRFGVDGHMQAKTPWYSYHENFRDPMSRLVGARPAEVVVMNSLTVNLHLMMVSFYRPTRHRYKVVIEESAFPSDTYAVTTHVRSRGFDPDSSVVLVRPRPGEYTLRTEDIEQLLDAEGAEVALVLLPGVQYYTGERLDMARITQAAQRAGALVGLDLAHAAGNVPVRLHDWGVDFAVWCNYKYLNAGPGAVGGCFVHQRYASERGLPRFAGWWGNDPATRFRLHLNSEFVPRDGADGWQLSNPAVFSLTPLLASLGQFDRIGLPALREKSEALTAYLEYLLDRLPEGSIKIITPRDPAARGCQLSVLVRDRPREVFDAIRARGIVADYRQPDVIRLAPVPLYNSYHDVWRAGQAFAEILDP